MQPKNILNIAKKYLLPGLSALLFLAAAFYNGYPLVYSDTSTYISSGFELETPIDRPITYGLFLRLTSLNGLSLWLTVFVQSLLLVFLIRQLVVVLKIEKPNLSTFYISVICVFTTGISWSASQLIADIFTPMLIILWAILLVDTERSMKRTLLFGFLIFFVSSMHMSHFLMSAFFSVLLLILRFHKSVRPYFGIQKIAVIFIASGLSFLVFAASYSKFKHVFFVAKMNESKVLKRILDEQCGTRNFKLCAFKDSLPPTANEFMWESYSPMNKLGGYSEVKQEFNEIIAIALTDKNYLKDIAVSSVKESSKQLISYNMIDGNGIFMEGTKLFERIKKRVPSEIDSYSNSKQQKGILLEGREINYFFSVCIILSFIFIVFVFWFKRGFLNLKLLSLILCSGIAINSIVCGTLAPVADRFGCRVIWLLILVVVLSMMSFKSASQAVSHEK